MIKIARYAASITKTSRNFVKRAAQNRIDWSKAPQDLVELHNKDLAPYSKNIFKRAVIWVKQYFEVFKNMVANLKETIGASKEKFGKKFSSKDLKAVKKSFFNEIKEQISAMKELINSVTIESKKTSTVKQFFNSVATKFKNLTKSTPRAPKAPKTPKAPKAGATPSFAGKSVSKIKLADLKEMAKAQGATEEMLSGAKTKAQVIDIIESLKANS